MAISTLRLNVAANTTRALADFNKFSRSLDNKFLVSGLKLDVVRSALSQINRDFTRAIGEQGLASASSLRAAQNQAALLTQTFKGFSAASAMAITTDIGTALNNVAVRAGGTMKDVQRTLSATPFISTRVGDDLRDRLTKGMMEFNKNMRRAGLGDNFGGTAQQFLMGRATGMQLVESGDPMAAFLGSEIVKRAGGEGYVFDPAERSRIMADIVGDKKISEQLELMAKRTYGFRIILEDLNTYLFNPEAGVFGSLRKVVDSAGNPTTMFDEVEKLTESVFGKDGMFAKLVKAIRSVFGNYDPMRPFIDGIQLMQRVFEKIGDYFQTSGFQRIVEVAKDVFDGVSKVFKGLYEQIGSGNFSARQITEGITDFNEAIREYVKSLGRTIRGEDVSKQGEFTGTVLGTLVEEIGKTSIVLVKELFATFIDKVPEIATKVLPALNEGINKMLTEVFGNELAGKVLKFVLGFVPGPIGAVARASTAGDFTGGGGNVLSMLAMGGAAFLGPAAALGLGRGALGLAGRLGTQRGRFDTLSQLGSRAQDIETYLNRTLYMDRLVTDRSGRTMSINRFSPLSRRIIDPLSARMRPSSVLPDREWFHLLSRSGFTPPFSYGMDPNFTGRMSLNDLNAFRRGRIVPYPVSRGSVNLPVFGSSGDLLNLGSENIANRLTPGLFSSEALLAGGGGRRSLRSRILSAPGRFMGRVRGGIRNVLYENSLEEYERRGLVPRGYVTPIGPQRHGEPWAYAPGISDIGGDFAPYMESGTAYSFERTGEIGVRENLASRINRRYGSGGRRAVLGRNIRNLGRRFGKRALIGAGITGLVGLGLFGGPGANAQTLGPATEQFIEQEKPATGASASWGALGEGVLTGAGMGSAFGPWGAAIGAVIGGALPLLDKGVREALGKSIGEFFNNIKKFFGDLGNSISQSWGNFTNWVGESLSWAGNALKDALKWAVNGIIGGLNFVLSNFTLIPRTMTQAIKGLVESIKAPFPGKETALKALGGIESFFSPQIPTFYAGKNLGSALETEARMSGRRPMVVNDGEFVIPKDGFPILAGLVGQNLRSTGVIGSANNNTPTQVNVSLSLTTHSVVANADELVETMREPVYKIISDAIKEVENSRISRTAIA